MKPHTPSANPSSAPPPGSPTPGSSDVPKGSDPENPAGFVPPKGEAEFLNRELSWLQFNRRVLAQALDERTPLLERLGFLAIFNSNLDEFFQKRVGGLKRQLDAGLIFRSPDGMSPKEQLKAIREAVVPMLQLQAACYTQDIKPALAERGIRLLRWDQLTEGERAYADRYFRENLFPVLTPLAVDPGHPFPFISNLSTSLAVMLRPPGDDTDRSTVRGVDTNEDGRGELQFARVKVPTMLPRWIRINPPGEDHARPSRGGEPGVRMVSLQEIIRHNLGHLFEGMRIEEVEPFRVSRNADVDRDQEDAEDLLELIEQELRDRRFARVVRLEVDNDPYLPLNQFLIRELSLHPKDVYEMPGELDYTDLWEVHKLDRPELKFQTWTPVTPPRLADRDVSIFSAIRQGDVLVHHPYESFSASVERFIREAASDPKVVAIKQTLYRTSADSPFIPGLIRAAEAGKQVVVLVELKARFDEERNVYLAQQLEKAGIHVVYGVMGLKTHTKTSLVVRRELDKDTGAERMRCYAHVGTGNYNSKTAKLYTDLGLFTCDPRITSDLVEMFHFLTGRSVKRDFKHLLVAPINMRLTFEQLIDREIENARAAKAAKKGGKASGGAGEASGGEGGGRIVAKMNSLEDKKMVRKLYAASQAGVKVQLIVRGFCCLRPGVPGMSENITVTSVIGRFLEHSRIYRFHNNGNPEYYIGSADWMYRNLNNRVECITPIYDPAAQHRLDQILAVMLADHRQAWDMQPDGAYTRRTPETPPPEASPPEAPSPGATISDQPDADRGTHQMLMDLTRQGAEHG